MSDNNIVLIPEDPHFVPSEDAQFRAVERMNEIAPNADGIHAKICDEIEFFDCGGNLQRIICPACEAELPVEWWHERMDDEYARGYPLEKTVLPCCGTCLTIHELRYEWPQGFGRFGLTIENANIGRLTDKAHREFEQILGCPLRVIYQHF